MSPKVHNIVEQNLDTVVDLERRLYSCFTPIERVTYRLTRVIGRIESLALQGVLALSWVIGNLRAVNPHPFDPWPFHGLELLLSFEAVVVTLLVLTTQRMMQTLDNHRAHMALQIALLNEQETTKVLEVLAGLEKRLGGVPDEKLKTFTQEVDTRRVSDAIKKSLEDEGPDAE